MTGARDLKLTVTLLLLVLSPCKPESDLEFLYKDNEAKENEAFASDRRDIDDIIKNEISRNDSSAEEDDEDIGAALQKLVRTAAILPPTAPTKIVSTGLRKKKIIYPSKRDQVVSKPNQTTTTTPEPLTSTERSQSAEQQSSEQTGSQEKQNNTKSPSKVAVVVVLSSCKAESLLNKSSTERQADAQAERQAERDADREAERQAERQANQYRRSTAAPRYADESKYEPAAGSIQYADSREADGDERAAQYYTTSLPPRAAKVSDLLTDHEMPFRRVLANQLQAPGSAYQKNESPMYTGLAQNPSQLTSSYGDGNQFQGLPSGFNFNSPGSLGGLGGLQGIPSQSQNTDGNNNFNPYTLMQQSQAGDPTGQLYSQLNQHIMQQLGQQQPSQSGPMDPYSQIQNQVATAQKIQNILANTFSQQNQQQTSPGQFGDYRRTNQPPESIINALPPSLKEAYTQARQGTQSFSNLAKQDKNVMTLKQVLSGNELKSPLQGARQSSQQINQRQQFQDLRQRPITPDLSAIQVYTNKAASNGVFSAKDMEPNPVQKIELQQYPHPKLGVEILSPNSLPMLQNPSIYNQNMQFPQIVQNSPPFYAQPQPPFAPMGGDFNQFPQLGAAQPNFGGQPNFGPPPNFGGQPNFGPPPSIGSPPGFGAPPGFGPPPGYGAPPPNFGLSGAADPNVQYYGNYAENIFGG